LPDAINSEGGVVTAKNAAQWASVLGHVALGDAIGSRYVKVVRGRKILIRFDRPVPYELDGGARRSAAKLRVKAHPSSVTVCVPALFGGRAAR
jgi:diacylglycerol kinase (ATP)